MGGGYVSWNPISEEGAERDGLMTWHLRRRREVGPHARTKGTW